MEDWGYTAGAQGAVEVVAFEDKVAGALGGAEEGERSAVEEGGVAYEGDGGTVGGGGRCRGAGQGGCRGHRGG